MITADEIESIRAELSRTAPARVLVYQGDNEVRRITVPGTKKRWQTVISVLAKLEFTRIEMVARDGGLLAVWDAPSDDDHPPAAMVGAREEGLLRLLLAGQQAVLANRERETAGLVDGCMKALGVMTGAVQALAQVHQAALESQATAFNAQLAQLSAQLSAAPVEGDGLQSNKLLELLAPMLMRQLMPPAPAPAPAKPTNGVADASK